MARLKTMPTALRGMALDPLRNFKNETLTVPEWDRAEVIVRAMSADDWIEYRRRSSEAIALARELAGLPEVADGEEDDLPLNVAVNPLYAFVLVRTLYDQDRQRLFDDADVDEVCTAFSPVHDRLVSKAFELSGAALGPVDPVEEAGNA